MTNPAPSETQPPQPGWWLASDGKWYPPESRAATAAPPATTAWTQDTAVRKRKRWPWVVGIIAVLFVIGAGSCVAIIGSVANKVTHDYEAHAITQVQFDSIHTGVSRQQVIGALGKQPEDSQQFVQKGVLTSNDVSSSCIYYNMHGVTFGHRYQFCFTNDQLESKNAY